ncbi:MAG: pilus assembly protein PilP [Oceanobacter sp.]
MLHRRGVIQSLTCCLISLLVLGCSGSADTRDLKQFVEQTLAKPRGRIEPIPVFKPYEYFSYSAARLRSPFDLPATVDSSPKYGSASSNVEPDLDRPKEYLEQFALGELVMVGTIAGFDNTLWALVRDNDGSVVRVREGFYMGRNHGRIIHIDEYRIDMIEIVPNGLGGWLERPKSMALNTPLGGEG